MSRRHRDTQHEHGKATMHGRLPDLVDTDYFEGIPTRWPHIGRFLRVDSTGRVDDDFSGWSHCVEDRLPPAERAAAYEEWSDFWEWRLTQRESELADDRVKRHLVATWTDSMTYSCRRSAAWARGEDPGVWVPQWRRRPDLHADSQAIVAEIIARLGARRRPAECFTVAG